MNSNTSQPDGGLLYRHDKRPQWGLAVVVWEREGKRGYQFADGNVRVFKEGFYDRFSPAVAPGDGSARAVVRMARRLENGDEELLPSVRHQAAYLSDQYDGGFAGPAWKKRHRVASRRLKRHRDPAIAEAQTRWAHDGLSARLAVSDWAGVVAEMVDVLRGSDLVTPAVVKRLDGVRPTEALARSFVALLHDDHTGRAFDTFRKSLAEAGGPATSWAVLTAPRALMHPSEAFCVRPSVMALQGRILVPGFEAPTRPSARDYLQFEKLAHGLRRELVQLGHAPRDLLDVYDFVWATLRPAARERVLEMPVSSTQGMQPTDAEAA